MICESVRQVATAKFPTKWGEFQIIGFERDVEKAGLRDRETAVALLMGNIKEGPPLLTYPL